MMACMNEPVPMIRATVYARSLQRAAQIMGGIDGLSRTLRVPRADLVRWMTGEVRPPQSIFLATVDIVLTVDFMLDAGALQALLAEQPKTPASVATPPGSTQ